MPAKLTPAELTAALSRLNAAAAAPWTLVAGKLHKEFQFADFARAFGFMATCALVAEKINHHPEWRNVYNRVRVDLTTHSAGGVTELDFTYARAMERAASAAN